MRWLSPILKNKYVIALIASLAWILFLDDHDVISLYNTREKLEELKEERAYYQEGIEETRRSLQELTTDPKTLEKFARERYLMKKKGEDVFVVVEEEEKEGERSP